MDPHSPSVSHSFKEDIMNTRKDTNHSPHYPAHVRLRLEKLRKKQGLSQEQVAARLGISQQSYSAYERGTAQLHIDQFVVLARLYNVSVDYITGASNVIREYPRM